MQVMTGVTNPLTAGTFYGVLLTGSPVENRARFDVSAGPSGFTGAVCVFQTCIDPAILVAGALASSVQWDTVGGLRVADQGLESILTIPDQAAALPSANRAWIVETSNCFAVRMFCTSLLSGSVSVRAQAGFFPYGLAISGAGGVTSSLLDPTTGLSALQVAATQAFTNPTQVVAAGNEVFAGPAFGFERVLSEYPGSGTGLIADLKVRRLLEGIYTELVYLRFMEAPAYSHLGGPFPEPMLPDLLGGLTGTGVS